MKELEGEHDFLARIPSPSARLWAGLCIILSIFVVFAVYSIHQIRWLEDFQIHVVERNRKASIQLLRLQNDANLLGISLRDMTLKQAQFPIAAWQSEFSRLHFDMSNALALEVEYSGPPPAGASTTEALEDQTGEFWQTADQAFDLAAKGEAARARDLIASNLEGKDSVIVATVASLL
ncbi:MAG: sensor histidine kinase, partial [Terriglobia bacterium]